MPCERDILRCLCDGCSFQRQRKTRNGRTILEALLTVAGRVPCERPGPGWGGRPPPNPPPPIPPVGAKRPPGSYSREALVGMWEDYELAKQEWLHGEPTADDLREALLEAWEHGGCPE